VEPSTTVTSITVVEHTNFAVSDRSGDMLPTTYHGFFVADTRFLSTFVVRINGHRLERLSAGGTDHEAATFYLANPRLPGLAPASIVVFRDRRIHRRLEERVRLISYTPDPVRVELSVEVGADFADIFEVRGRRRMRRTVVVEREPRRMRFSYAHAGFRRATSVTFSREMTPLDGRLSVIAELERGVPWDLNLVAAPERSHDEGAPVPHPEARSRPRLVRRWLEALPELSSGDSRIVRAWRQAGRDMASLLLTGPSGNFLPAAGLPWFLAVFGRDACITALQTMMLGSEITYGTLRQLAAYQGTRDDRWREEEPGKIPHEVRTGELATLDRVPFARYYGSVDATPLFVMLFVAACRWSGWLARHEGLATPIPDGLPDPLRAFLPAVERAMAWIDRHTDADGLVWYDPRHRRGITNQVWKDSRDSMRYTDGRIALPPIAAVEVQGYVIAARRGMADVYRALGREEEADRHLAVARRLAAVVDDAMWLPDEGTYAMGLDPERKPIDGVASNAGHLLWCGTIPARRASAVAQRLMAPDLFSGWGVRTLSSRNPGYNPIGYHIGSVWPHDNSLIAAGLAAYGKHDAAWRVIDALLDAATAGIPVRLPELFAGFDRTATPDLVPYPTACAPQAWATGAIVLGVQTMLGLTPGAHRPLVRPMPEAPGLRLAGIRIGAWQGNLGTDAEEARRESAG
jgi:glycogen debranching enzyme